MRFFWLLSFILLSLNTSCQSDTNFIPIAAYWQKGDKYNFKITKIKRTWQDKKLTQNDSSQYIALFHVTGEDSSSYTIEWTYKNNLFDLLKIPAETADKFPQYKNPVVIYKTDEFGAFDEVINWRDISNMIAGVFNEMVEADSKDPDKAANLKRSLEPLLKVYSTQRGIEQLVLKELLMMHFPYGKQYERGEIYNYTEQIPVMKNSEPVTGDGIIFIRFANSEKQRCELVQRMKVLPDSAKKMLTGYFQSIGMRPEAIPGTVKSSIVEVNDENIYDFFYDPGIPIKITVSRETRINVLEDNIKQTDLTVIERIVP